ncbi:hypothetical protein BLNAU_8334 [Blattamonas nauphoetae]|uniref:Uncharacterized protein n=1 Tax=Blattamonas nauphoetae TaxID=2049346 RepID=A0ABQ9XYY8_9EUKA|nr:hypothetical protein BLNAU_8334 [Blattamonas nauphoetae]
MIMKDKDNQLDDIQSPDPADQDIDEKDDEMEGKSEVSDKEGGKDELEEEGAAEVGNDEEGEIKTLSFPPSTQNDKTDPNVTENENEDDKMDNTAYLQDNEENEEKITKVVSQPDHEDAEEENEEKEEEMKEDDEVNDAEAEFGEGDAEDEEKGETEGNWEEKEEEGKEEAEGDHFTRHTRLMLSKLGKTTCPENLPETNTRRSNLSLVFLKAVSSDSVYASLTIRDGRYGLDNHQLQLFQLLGRFRSKANHTGSTLFVSNERICLFVTIICEDFETKISLIHCQNSSLTDVSLSVATLSRLLSTSQEAALSGLLFENCAGQSASSLFIDSSSSVSLTTPIASSFSRPSQSTQKMEQTSSSAGQQVSGVNRSQGLSIDSCQCLNTNSTLQKERQVNHSLHHQQEDNRNHWVGFSTFADGHAIDRSELCSSY